MKTIIRLCCAVMVVMGMHSLAVGQTDTGVEKFKAYVNDFVQDVQAAEAADEKRAILNASFDEMISGLERLQSRSYLTDEDRAGIAVLMGTILEKKDELNGVNGFTQIEDANIDDFANFVQQDFEQANTLVISIGASTLAAILLLLLLL